MNAVTAYVMNPAEDVVLYGDELRKGMWVMREDITSRSGGSEDRQLRHNRFHQVTKLRRTGRVLDVDQMRFVGVWVDGYQESYQGAVTNTWIVKLDSLPDTEAAS